MVNTTDLIARLRADNWPEAKCAVTSAAFSPVKDYAALVAERRQAATLLESQAKQLEVAREVFKMVVTLMDKHMDETAYDVARAALKDMEVDGG